MIDAFSAIDIEALYSEHVPRVFSFALRMLGDEEDARDIVQETFAAALASADSFRGESSALTWILAIAKNRCLMRLRGARELTFDGIETLIDREAEEISPAHSELERRYYVEAVKEGCLLGLLQCLPCAQRCVFILHLLNELSIAEVGKIMGKSDNAIRVLLSRARSGLRDFLCENCSLMSGTKCSCANMVEFSLKRGLIERYRPEFGIPAIREELLRFADEVQLFRSLPEPEAAISRLLTEGRYRILSEK